LTSNNLVKEKFTNKREVSFFKERESDLEEIYHAIEDNAKGPNINWWTYIGNAVQNFWSR
jgi:hypothetical protein